MSGLRYLKILGGLNMESDKERFDRLKSMRKGAKVVNYSSLYGVG